MLSIVATPIGNLEDITLRALRMLKEVDFIIAEDTRHSGILLKKYEITTRMISFHSYSTEHDLDKIMGLLTEGKHLCLITDAGTPGISDPGYRLITEAIRRNIPITSLPGPSAVVNALVLSALPMHRFLYLGFLPLKKGRKKLLASLKKLPYTIVLYEAPHRIVRTLKELAETLGANCKIAVCREMTKVFEEVVRGSLAEVAAHFEKHKPKGEFTVVLGGASKIRF